MRSRVVVAVVAMILPACSGATTAASSPSPAANDAATERYVQLVNDFWTDHVTATSGAQTVCLGTDLGTPMLNPALCKERGTAMLAVQQKFADALAGTTAPARFADADRAIRQAMPPSLADLKAMISAAAAGNAQTMRTAALQYVSDMQPMLLAFDQISPGVQHV